MKDIDIMDSFVTFAILATTIFFLIKAYIKRRYGYWQRRNIYFLKPEFPFGNARKLFNKEKNFPSLFIDAYFQIKAAYQKEGGFFFLMTPQYIPVDPDIIKNILQKDFHHFMDRGIYYNERDDPLSAHLFTMEGSKWKNLRSKLTPTFTSGKMKMMFPSVVKSTEELVDLLNKRESNEGVEVKDLLARLTTDIIGTCAFGIDCNSVKDPEAEFRKIGRLIFERNYRKQLMDFCTFVFPNLMRRLRVCQIPKICSSFYMNMIKETVKYREANNVRRKDFIDLLIQIKNKGRLDDEDNGIKQESNEVNGLTIEQLAGQSFVFFVAGFETSSSTMSFCLYELSLHEDIQIKLRDEIHSVLKKYAGSFTYEAMKEMKYMDMVVYETLRKYPSLPALNRICTMDYKVPQTNLRLEKGTQLVIPIQGIHYDPEYYPDPYKFMPERFSEENKAQLHPFTYFPFGEGPRICIGKRFGLMQTKVGLALLLNKYKFKLNPKTPVPLVMDQTKVLNAALGGIWLDVTDV